MALRSRLRGALRTALASALVAAVLCATPALAQDRSPGASSSLSTSLPLGGPSPPSFARSRNVRYTANLVPDMRQLQLSINGQGQVETSPPGPSIPAGTAVAAYATPSVGQRFVGWSGSVVSDSVLIHFQIDSDMSLTATFELDPATTDVASVPVSWSLSPVVPNPGRGDFQFRIGSPSNAQADLSVLDAGGRRVRMLLRGAQPAGWRTITWDGRDEAGRRVAPGRYWLRLLAGGRTLVRELSLLR